MPSSKERRAFSSWLLLALLCLWGAARWLLPDGEMSAAEPYWIVAAGSLLAATCMWGLAMREPAEPGGRRVFLQAAAGGFCWLVGMQLPLFFGAANLTSASKTIALALCPVVIAVLDSASRHAVAPDLPGRLWPGLTGVAGLLLLLPEPSLANWQQVLGLAGMPLLAGTGAALIGNTHTPGRRLRAVALTGACVPAVIAALLQRLLSHGEGLQFAWPPFLSGAGAEAVSLLLAFSVLSRQGAWRWAASLIIVPLLVALQGVLMLHPEIGARAFLGMGLLGLAAVLLLWKPEARGEDTWIL